MQIKHLAPGATVKCGDTVATFLRMSGTDALVMLSNGKRVAWSSASPVEIVEAVAATEVDDLPRLRDRLATLLRFSEGKYAKLGVSVDTPCTPLPKNMHEVFVAAALGVRPSDAIVCRRCTTRLCIRADHLFWGTRSDCQRDMVLRGVARPRGKSATLVELLARIARLQRRITRLEQK